ncbi:hypothetical protein [Kineosporia babensis]|uniref:Uncharacterized protein n=1 Tax=Kineosporia babensis TaxID=499548 RepID=A0A9X1T3W8_9ACTN|nr:hypothetical protein [Kineosporia babensis]MCD5316153.1 hypothetical protein [Kineosporia babensis]
MIEPTSPAEVLSAWKACVSGAREEHNSSGLTPDLPWTDGEWEDRSDLKVAVDRNRILVIPNKEVTALRNACARWPKRSEDGHNQLTASSLLVAVAEHRARNDPDWTPPILRGVQKSVVTVPVGGIFGTDDVVKLGTNCVAGHMGKSVQSKIDSLVAETSPEIGMFRFTDDVTWSQEWVAAEEDDGLAADYEEMLINDEGWTPFVVALRVNDFGSAAVAAALRAVQCFCAAAWILDTPADVNRRMPWILGWDGPTMPYITDQSERAMEFFTSDPSTRRREFALQGSVKWQPSHEPVSVGSATSDDLAALLHVVNGSLGTDNPAAAELCALVYAGHFGTSFGAGQIALDIATGRARSLIDASPAEDAHLVLRRALHTLAITGNSVR